MKRAGSLLLTAATLFLIACQSGNVMDPSYPKLQKKGNSVQIIVDESPFLILGGELHNSSMGGLEYMRTIWEKMAQANINTVISTASWELVEPEEGNFDFTLVDSMIYGAKSHGLKLVVIWFGSWKNGASTYVPSWVKLDQKRFPLVITEEGKKINTLSTLSDESCNADSKAFAALMRHIRQIDGTRHTVIAVQVENEMGTLGTKRDFSEAANNAFNGQVPAELIQYLEKNRATLHPGIMEAWSKQGYRQSGTWEEVFGKGSLMDTWKDLSYLTEELFMAWNYGRYVGKVAAAGKAEYDIPMYVNAWLKQPGTSGFAPGNYPSGGPTPQVLDIWRAAASSIDFIAPDIYIVNEYRYVCDQYTLSGNPLFIPETTGDAAAAARAFFTYGKYSAMCFSPFGVDGGGYWGADVGKLNDIKNSYGILKELAPFILKYQGTDDISGLMADNNSRTDSVITGGYKITARTFSGKGTGGALIMHTGTDEFIVAGRNMFINFLSETLDSTASFLSLEDGRFDGEKWIPGRRLNGDEFWPILPADSGRIYKIKLYKY